MSLTFKRGVLVLAALISLVMAGTASASGCGVVPAGVLSCIPVNVVNTQGSPTSSGFQLRLSSLPVNVLAGNVIVYNGLSGATLPSWAETNSVLWVNLKANTIAASGSFNGILYLGLGGPGTNFFIAGNNIGEAPQLSSSYGQYDNIASVMNTGLIYQIYYHGGSACGSGSYQTNLYNAKMGNPVTVSSCATFASSTNPFSTAATGSTQNVNGNTQSYVILNYQSGDSGGSPYPNPPVANTAASWLLKAVGWADFSSTTSFYELADDGITLSYAVGGGDSSGSGWLGGSSNPNNLISGWVDQAPTPYHSSSLTRGAYRMELDFYENGGGTYSALWSSGTVNYYSATYPPGGVQPTVTFGAKINYAPAITILPTSNTIDAGQSITFTNTISGGTPPFTYSYTVNSMSGVTVAGNTITFANAGTFNVMELVTDNLGYTAYSSNSVIKVNKAFRTPTISALPTQVATGYAETFSSYESGGTAPYTYNFLVYNSPTNTLLINFVTGSNSVSWTVPSSFAGNAIYANVIVTDSASTNAVANSVNSQLITITSPLENPTISASSTTVYSGQSITFYSEWSGGTPPYTAKLYSSQNGGCNEHWWDSGQNYWFIAQVSSGSDPSATFNSVVPSTSKAKYYCVIVNDSSSPQESGTSPALHITLSATPPTISMTTTNAVVDSGQYVTYNMFVTGGIGPFTVELYNVTGSRQQGSLTVNIPSPGAANSNTITFQAGASGIFTFNAIATDTGAGSFTFGSTHNTITVNRALSVGVTTQKGTVIDAGQSIALSANVADGTPPYSYQWYTGSGCASIIDGETSPTYSASPGATSSFTYLVTDSATQQSSACSQATTITVNQAPQVGSWSISNSIVDLTQSETLSAAISYGTPPYTYNFMAYTPAGELAYKSIYHTPLTSNAFSFMQNEQLGVPGTWVANILMGDSASGTPTESASGTLTYTVNPQLDSLAYYPSTTATTPPQDQTLTADWTGGYAPYTLLYQVYDPFGTQVENEQHVAATSPDQMTFHMDEAWVPGVYAATLAIEDSASANLIATNSTHFVVCPAGYVNVTLSNSLIDNQQYETVGANVDGCVAPFTYNILVYNPSDDLVYNSLSPPIDSVYNSVSFPQSEPFGLWTVNVIVTDSETPSAISFWSEAAFTVSDAPTAGDITTPYPKIDSGQNITLTANPSSGTAPYSYAWYSSASGNPSCDPANLMPGELGSALTDSPTSDTVYTYLVTDSASTPIAQCSSPYSVTVNPDLDPPSISPSGLIADNGQTVAFSSSWSGGTAPYGATLYSSQSTRCDSDSTPLQTLSSLLTGSASFDAVTPPTSTYYCILVTDDAPVPVTESSPTALVAVNTAPSLALSTMNAVVDSGQFITYTISESDGVASSFDAQLYSVPGFVPQGADVIVPRDGSNSVTIEAGDAGTYSFNAVATDYGPSAPFTFSSGQNTIIVNPTLEIPSISPIDPTYDLGQDVALTGSWSGGTPSYRGNWTIASEGTPVYNTVATGLLSATDTLSLPAGTLEEGTYSANLIVTDGTDTPETVNSVDDTFTINSALIAGDIYPDSPISSGTYILLSSNAVGGTPPYTYQWYSDSSCGTPIGDATSNTYNARPSATTDYTYAVTDSAQTPVTACSNSDTITVPTTLLLTSVQGSLSNTVLDLGQQQTVTADWVGGTPTYNVIFQVYNSVGLCRSKVDNGISTAPDTFTYQSSATCGIDTLTVNLTLYDSETPNAVATDSLTYMVNPLPTISVSPATATIDAGQSVTFTNTTADGTPPYRRSYSTNATDATITGNKILFPTAGTYNVVEYVQDSTGANVPSSNSGNTLITVVPDPTISAWPLAATIDHGQSNTLLAGWSNGKPSYTVYWYYGPTAADCLSYENLKTSHPGLTRLYDTLTVVPTSNTYYCFQVQDSASYIASSPANEVTVNPVLSISAQPSPSSINLDNGQSYQFGITASGGTPSYSYAWNHGTDLTPVDCGTTSSTCTVTAAADSGTPTINVILSDASSSPPSVPSSSATVNLHADPSFSLDLPSSINLDNGQSTTLSVSVTGGYGTYSYAWHVVSGSGLTLGTCNTATCVVTATSGSGSETVNVVVTDTSSNTPYISSLPERINLYADPSFSTDLPSSIDLDQGQSTPLTASVTGGHGDYSYSWYVVSGSGLSSITGCDTATCVVTATSGSGSETVNVVVTDTTTNDPYVSSSSETISLYADPSFSTDLPSSIDLDQGQSTPLTVTPTGGNSDYSYSWYVVSGSGLSSLSGCNTATCVVTATSGSGSETVNVVVTDTTTNDPYVSSSSETISLYADPSFSTDLPSSIDLDQGRSTPLTVTPTGGNSDYSYSWYVVSGSGLSSITGCDTATCVVTATSGSGSETVNVVVTDTTTNDPYVSSSSETINLHADPSFSTDLPSSIDLDQGQSTSLTVSVTGGHGDYSYSWYVVSGSGLSSISGCNTATCVVTASDSSGSETVNVVVTDTTTNDPYVSSSSETINLHADPSFSPDLPSSIDLDQGQSTSLTVTPTGGNSDYSYSWYVVSGSGLSSPSGCDTATCVVTATGSSGSETVNVVVTDTTTNSPSISSSETVTLYSVPTFTTDLPSSMDLDNGQSNTLAVSVTGGDASYSYTWATTGSLTMASCGTSSPTCTITAAANSGSGTVNVVVTDTSSNSISLLSNTLTVNLHNALSPTLTSNGGAYDAGQTITFTGSTGGGTSAFTYNYFNVTGSNVLNQYTVVADTSNAFSFTAGAAGTFTYNLIITDNAVTPMVANSVTNAITVHAALTTPTRPGPSNAINVGGSTMLTSAWTGGTPNYQVKWYSSSSSTCTASGTPIATYSGITELTNSISVSPTADTWYCLTIKDSAFNSVTTPASSANEVVVNPTVSLSPSSASITLGSTEVFTVTVTGGLAPYNVVLYDVTGSNAIMIGNTIILSSGGSNTVSFATSAIGTFNYNAIIADSATPNVIANSITNTIVVSAPPTTTTISSPSGGFGGGGSGGPAPVVGFNSTMTSNNNTMTFNNHTITINNTGNGTMAVNGYHFYNQSRDDSHTITINGKQVTITINFVSPTSAGISVNGAAYTLTVGQMITVDDPIYITLKALSYLPIKQGIDLDVFSIKPASASTTVASTTVPMTIGITSISTTIKSTTIATIPSTTILSSSTVPVGNNGNGSGEAQLIVAAILVIAVGGLAYYYLISKRKT